MAFTLAVFCYALLLTKPLKSVDGRNEPQGGEVEERDQGKVKPTSVLKIESGSEKKELPVKPLTSKAVDVGNKQGRSETPPPSKVQEPTTKPASSDEEPKRDDEAPKNDPNQLKRVEDAELKLMREKIVAEIQEINQLFRELTEEAETLKKAISKLSDDRQVAS